MKDEKKSIVSGEIYEKAYSLSNYKIEIDETIKTNICALYVSSSGIYYPNNEDALRECILQKDTFEWYATRFKKAKKHIFIRDVAKQFYITGINKELDTVDKTVSFLRAEVKGYDLYVIGSSAGGYMASILAEKLKAKLLVCFSAYFNLNIVDHDVWFYISKYANDERRNQYYNISEMITNYTGLMLYFYPSELKDDVAQSKQICSNDHLFKIPIKSKIHGVPISINATKLLMSYTEREIRDNLSMICRMANKTQRKIDCDIFGLVKGNYLFFINFFSGQKKRIINYIKRRLQSIRM